MKKLFSSLALLAGEATFLSLFLECLLTFFGFAMTVSPDDAPAAYERHPRYFAACILVGLLALAALVGVLILHGRASEKFGFSTRVLWVQAIVALLATIPMIKLWEMTFDFLQKAF